MNRVHILGGFRQDSGAGTEESGGVENRARLAKGG